MVLLFAEPWEEKTVRSMTGYGCAAVSRDQREITAEIKTVNHRFLDLNIKLPRGLISLEDRVRKKVSSSLVRGHADVLISYRNLRDDAVTVRLDAALLRQYVHAVEDMAAHILPGETELPDTAFYASLPGVLTEDRAAEDTEAVWQLMEEALGQALDQVAVMREREGQSLAADLSLHLDRLAQIRLAMEEPAKNAPALYQQQLENRLQQLRASVPQDRLAQEVALFADRAAVDEELSRLQSHIGQAGRLIAGKEPAGKKLDFLMQEMNREANTIASKSPDLALTDLAMDAKNEIEKLREQVQNAE